MINKQEKEDHKAHSCKHQRAENQNKEFRIRGFVWT